MLERPDTAARLEELSRHVGALPRRARVSAAERFLRGEKNQRARKGKVRRGASPGVIKTPGEAWKLEDVAVASTASAPRHRAAWQRGVEEDKGGGFAGWAGWRGGPCPWREVSPFPFSV